MSCPAAPAPTRPPARPSETADLASAHALFGCYLREVAAPDGDVEMVGGTARVRLRHLDRTVLCRVTRISPILAHRYTGQVRCLPGSTIADVDRPADRGHGVGPDAGHTVDAVVLAELFAAELATRTGTRNDEFVGQVAASRGAIDLVLRERPARDPAPTGDPVTDAYVASEQSLVYGHPHHPSPKWHGGDPVGWRRHAPELRTSVRLSWLAVPAELLAEDGPFDDLVAELDPPAAPTGHRLLPVHPWQLSLVPPADRRLRVLGPAGAPLRPTASVRTLYAPAADLFLKASLHVRITNCLRKNARYELTGAVALTRHLSTVALPPGVGVLTEPAYRTVDLAGLDEAYGTIVRTGIRAHVRPGESVVLAAALAAAPLTVADPVGWWRSYVRLLVPAVLRLWLAHGVVPEAHLQNVLVVRDAAGRPVRLVLRDLEGLKLDTGRVPTWPVGLPREVAYSPAQAYRRIAYCLFVNHLGGLAGALADGRPGIEAELWNVAHAVVEASHADLGGPPELAALLAGAPLPAKANLLVRWQRAADRNAPYVTVPGPFGGAR
ncbi:Siderophore synthetase component [Micromonospora nigra]|uniref:Siderophore synthetase component n=1 Tax=Micromonospora nigra TaxID=145857 RepID=A0A1C6T216_9ACTN|nr:IucA/IucC family protein [Micromonospora nigra]SCL35747.1 Siderophore synthetase component [Micromonospora nigra]